MTAIEVARDIFQVQLPLPFALRSVNCYLLRSDSGWDVVDTGLHTPDGEAAWQAVFAELHIEPGAISRIVLTHYHPDHYGMAGWLQSQSGAPILISPREAELAEQVWGKPEELPDPMVPLFTAHGTPDDLASTLSVEVSRLRAATRPHGYLSPLAAGAAIELGGRTFQTIHAPGHSDGQLIFYDPEDRLVLSGDHVLMKITPHIGFWPESEPDPLGRYLNSLADLESLDVGLALPGHGPLIETWAARLSELRRHHAERLEAMLMAVESEDSAFAVATRVFDFARYTPHEMRFAVAETIAHLEYLVCQGQLQRLGGEQVRYAQSGEQVRYAGQ